MNRRTKNVKYLTVLAAAFFWLTSNCYALRADFDDNNSVWINDFAILAHAWLSTPEQPNWDPRCDISEPNDDVINFLDFAVLATEWATNIHLKITIDHTKVAGDLNDFPVLINQTNLPDNFWWFCQNYGTNIYVTTADNPNVKLSRELVEIDVNSKIMELWVKVPAISSVNDTVLNLYYTNSYYETNDVNTWSNGFAMVQHMNQDPCGPPPQMLDSSPYLNDGTTYGNMTPDNLVLGQIAHANDFNNDSNDDIDCGNDDSLNFSNALFVEQDTNLYYLDSHQGVAADGNFIYTIDTLKIYKRFNYPPYQVVMSKSNLLSNIPGDPNQPDHFGDGVVCNGYLYVAAEYIYSYTLHNTHSIIKIDTNDLSYVTYFDIDVGNHEVSGVATDGNILYAVSYFNGSKIWKYDISDGNYLGYIPLSQWLSCVQGITYRASEDRFYISVDCGIYNKNIVVVDKNGTVIGPVWSVNTQEMEGLDYSQNQMLFIENNQYSSSHLHLLMPRDPFQGFTLSAWANPFDIQSEHAILSRYKYTMNQRQYYLLAQNYNWAFRLGTNGGRSAIYVTTPASVGTFSYVTALYRPSTGTIELYVNGVLKKTQNYTGNITAFNQTTYIGDIDSSIGPAPFSGILDEVRVENIARSPEWIATCYNNQSSPPTFYSVSVEF